MTEYICKKEKKWCRKRRLASLFYSNLVYLYWIYGSKSVSQFEVEFLHLDSFFIEFQVEYWVWRNITFLEKSWKIQDKINKVNVKDRWCRFTSITVCYGPNWSEGQHTTTGSVRGGTKVRHMKVCCSIPITTPSLSQLSFIFVTCPAVSLHELQPSGSHSISVSVVYMSHP